MAWVTIYVTWKRDFLQNVVKTNKNLKNLINRVVYVTLKRETISYSVLFIFFIETWKIQRKLLKNSLLDVNTYFYFLREDRFDIKIS